MNTCQSCSKDVTDCSCDNCVCVECMSANCSCLSGLDGKMDTLVRQATMPSLGTLFRSGIKSGLIKPQPSYGQL